tara:strand:+ start:3434 stop:3730 length:297 start_codon:yes stop_codon:yes gene_type:complete
MARQQTNYEWRVNQRDEHGDCVDFDTFSTYAEALHQVEHGAWGANEIELTRQVGDDDNGLYYMEYATVVNGTLPEYFDEGGKVNKAHHAEVARAHKAA